jgi:N-acetylglutamate synthase-like GNAT family acetyltransferase
MTELPLRRAGPADASAVRALTRLAYHKWVPLIGREPLPMTADYDRAIVEHRIDLYERGGIIIALIETVVATDHLLIENIAVHPEQQGGGLGTRLLQHAEMLARSLGLEALQLYTNAQFTSNLAFYAQRGFRETRRTEVAPGTVRVDMKKMINQPAGVGPR